MTYVADELYHFVGRKNPADHETNYHILLKILDEGWITHYPHHHIIADSISFNLDANLVSGDLVIPSMTCYCDIPLTSIDIHATKYGFFGVAFDRAKLISVGARPVTYIPTQPSDWRGHFATIHGLGLLKDLEGTWRGAYEFIEQSTDNPHTRSLGVKPEDFKATAYALTEVFTRQLAFVKAFNSELAPDHPDNYYMEREWRLIGNFKFEEKDLRSVLIHESYRRRLEEDRPRLAHLAISLPL
jgi:hypothetical protein